MKKKLFVLGLVFGLCMGSTSLVRAAQIPVVCLSDQEQFEYYMDSDEMSPVECLSLTQFVGMSQGDMRTQTIRLHNKSGHRANFYITKETISALQIQNLTSNGQFRFQLQVGKSLSTAESLLAKSMECKKDEIQKKPRYQQALNNFVYLTTLDAGQDTFLFLTFKLDIGNSMEAQQHDYIGMLEDIPVAFRVYDHESGSVYTDEAQQLYSTESTEVLESGSTKQAGNYKYGIFGIVLLGGAGLVGAAVSTKNRKNNR